VVAGMNCPEVGAVVVLAGGLSPSPLARTAGRSVLDLWVASGESVLARWVSLLEGSGMLRRGAARVIHSREVPTPMPERGVEVRTERDGYRGPAGAVADATEDLGTDELVVVIEANRYHACPLDEGLGRGEVVGADLVICCNADHSPAGVYLIRRSVLERVPAAGYMDLKEQLIARAVEADHRVAHVEYRRVCSVPIRTRRELLWAARLAQEIGGARPAADPGRVLTGHRWTSVVASDAEVAPGATVVESIVMPGAFVGEGALVARSVVCPGGMVRAGETALDKVVRAEERAPMPRGTVRVRSRLAELLVRPRGRAVPAIGGQES